MEPRFHIPSLQEIFKILSRNVRTLQDTKQLDV